MKLSHHGKDPSKIEQLTIVESEMMKALGGMSLNPLFDRRSSGS